MSTLSGHILSAVLIAFPPQDADEWARQLRGQDSEKWDKARRHLLEMGEKALPALESSPESDDRETRLRVAEVVGRIRWAGKMTPALEKRANSILADLGRADPLFRLEGVRRLEELASEREDLIFLALMQDESFAVARQAYRHFPQFGPSRMLLDGMLHMLGVATTEGAELDGGKEISAIVERILGCLHRDEHRRLEPLLRSTRDPAKLCGTAMAAALGDQSAGAALVRMLDGAEWQLRIALQGLARIAVPDAAERLGKIWVAKDVPADLRALAAAGLGKLEKTIDARQLIEWAIAKDDGIALASLLALTALRNEEAVCSVLESHPRFPPDERSARMFAMVAGLDTDAGFRALGDRLKKDGFMIRGLRWVSHSVRDTLLKRLFPIWMSIPESSAREARVLDTAFSVDTLSAEVKELASLALADTKSTPYQRQGALILLKRPLTRRQEERLSKYIVEWARSDLVKAASSYRDRQFRIDGLAPALRERIRTSPDPEVIRLLASCEDRSDIPLIRALLDSPDQTFRIHALTALADLGDTEVVGALIEELREPKTMQRAAVALGKLWTDELAQRFKGLFKEERFRAGWHWILYLFTCHRDALLIPDYRPLLKDPDAGIRLRAATYAGVCGDSAAKEELRTLMKDREWAVRFNALLSLAKLGEGTIEADLDVVLAGEQRVLFAEIEVLAALGTPTSIGRLARLSVTADAFHRGKALEELINAGRKEALAGSRHIVEWREEGYANLWTGVRGLARFGGPSDAALVYPIALEGDSRALAALDAIVHRERYAGCSTRFGWNETRGAQDELAARVSKAYGVTISLSDDLRSALQLRTPAVLWGEQDLYGAIEQLTSPHLESAPLFDAEELRLVTVEEAVAFWKNRPPK